jgi:hypothetical protein
MMRAGLFRHQTKGRRVAPTAGRAVRRRARGKFTGPTAEPVDEGELGVEDDERADKALKGKRLTYDQPRQLDGRQAEMGTA